VGESQVTYPFKLGGRRVLVARFSAISAVFYANVGRSRYAKEYDDALIFKTFVFQFANAYFAMYLLRGILA
jgi:hypothetical protein